MARSTGQTQLLLAGDVGGTKTDLAVVSQEAGPRRPLARNRYPSSGYASLAEMARAFLNDAGLGVNAACFDVAGPVINGRAQLTNLAWQLDEASLATELGVDRTWLLNDLVATASAIPVLKQDELERVKEGQALPGSPIAVLAPGTGLGEAFLIAENGTYHALASEGGHAAFAPTGELELELLRHLWRQFDHVSFERVASGVGIPNIYEFLREGRGMAESETLAAQVSSTEDRTRPILQAALDPSDPDPLAQATLSMFLGILGTEAANLALKVLGTGGVYLAGGIAQAVARVLPGGPFVEAFTRAGRFTAMLERIPVSVVKGEVALLGVATEGLRLLVPK